MGLGGSCDVVASRDMSDFTAFWALLSRIEGGLAWVEANFCGLGAGEGGGEGRSVVQASQQR